MKLLAETIRIVVVLLLVAVWSDVPLAGQVFERPTASTDSIEYHDRSFLAVYPFHWSIPLGGFVFGVGAAINGAWFTSTFS